MGKMRKRFTLLLLAVLILTCFPVVSVRAEGDTYTYTIRFYTGQQGTFANGQEMISFNVSYGDIVAFYPGSVVLKDGSKYYIKGIRESGRDNNTVSASSFMVTGDRDYVVAYGLRGNVVAYTVNYVDVSGKELAPSDIYYGNVGDKPVVAFLYIDGYQPQANNLTKTLVENEAENVFTFVYTSLNGNTGKATVTKTVKPGTKRESIEIFPGDFIKRYSAGNTEYSDNTGIDIGDSMAGTGLDGDGIFSDEIDGIDLDGVDLEETSVPLADMKFNIGPIEVDARLLLILLVIIIASLIITLASYWYWKPYRKKDDNEEKNAAQPV